MSDAMSGSYGASARAANPVGAKSCIESPRLCTPSDIQVAITEIIKRRYPKGMKAWAQLCDWFDLKERAAKHRLANSASYTIEELQVLLQQNDGYEILQALMAEAKPRWWNMLEQTMTLARARHLQEMARQEVLTLETAPLDIPLRRKTKGLANADRKLTAARSGQEASLGLLLADSVRPSHSAMAQAKTKTACGRNGRRGRR